MKSMEKRGLLISIVQSVDNIDFGRKKLASEVSNSEGRIALMRGLSTALDVFNEVHDNVSSELEMVILAEHAFITEELRYSVEPMVASSLSAALASFDDALRVLVTVQNPVAYQNAETSWPRHRKYRHHNSPKDAFHIAAASHVTRLRNTLRTPGINNTERQVYAQRVKNMSAAQNAYLVLQKEALSCGDEC
ncbi:hypothetical protein SAMD00024442_28_31 [Candidatus Symbiothrix dinenymphae]|nr:hypothetical protein SAMD00024442_28_31 [Candidatus Symbiothrix dinenymphae]